MASFGATHRLEPISSQVRARWLKEIEWLLLPVQHIVIMRPTIKVLDDGSRVEVMQQQLREDIADMLPALRSIDDKLHAAQARFRPGDIEVSHAKSIVRHAKSRGMAHLTSSPHISPHIIAW